MNKLFTHAAPAEAAGKADPTQLRNQLFLLQARSLDTIGALSEEDLDKDIEPTQVPHPVAKSKFEAIDWNIKHTMWHCGQIGILKRIIDERFDFGLQRNR